MFYANQALVSKKPNAEAVREALLIPPGLRENTHHTAIYSFCCHLPTLLQIQRVKSLNASLVCTSQLLLIQEKSYCENSMIAVGKLSDMVIIIQKAVVKEAIKYDENDLITKINDLSKAVLWSSCQYNQQLYLASRSCKVKIKNKEFVYQQGDLADFLYLVLEGEFSIISFHQHLNSYSPNRNKPKNRQQVKVGIISCGAGQYFGQEVILGLRTRQYSIKCESAENQLFQIPKEALEVIMEGNPQLSSEMRQQSIAISQFNREKLASIQRTKKNLPSIIESVYQNRLLGSHKNTLSISCSPQAISTRFRSQTITNSYPYPKETDNLKGHLSARSPKGIELNIKSFLCKLPEFCIHRAYDSTINVKSKKSLTLGTGKNQYCPGVIDSDEFVRQQELIFRKKKDTQTLKGAIYPMETFRKKIQAGVRASKPWKSSGRSPLFMGCMLSQAMKRRCPNDNLITPKARKASKRRSPN